MAIFSKSFWLGAGITVFNSADWILAWIFIAFLALAIFSRVLKALTSNAVLKNLYGRLFNWLLVFAIVGGLWSGLRYLLVPYIGARVTAGLILLGFLVWLGFTLFYLFTRFGKEKAEWEARQVRDRYLKSRN